MAKSSTRRVTIFINGKEVEASVKQIRAEMNRLVNVQNRMVIGSDEYISHAKKIKELRQYLKEHAQNIGSAASAWSEMYNKVLQFGTGIGGLTQILSSLDNVTSTLKQVATDLAARGLDIEAVENVIHYHLPPTPQALTHRNGRTARVDRSGRVYFIIAEGENVPEYVDWDHDFHPDHDAPLPPQPQMVTYYANAGRKEKVSRGDLVGLLCKTVGLTADQIGRIDVRDHSAYVAVASDAAPQIPAITLKIKAARLRLTPLK